MTVLGWIAAGLFIAHSPPPISSALPGAIPRNDSTYTEQSASYRELHRFSEFLSPEPLDSRGDRGPELSAQGGSLTSRRNSLEQRILAQKRRLNYRTPALAHNWIESPSQWHSDYRKQEEINQALRHAAAHREDLRLESLGKSVEGRMILGLTVPGRGALAKKRILVLGTQHAREWLSPMACMSMLRNWIDRSESSAQKERPTMTVVPVVNPDGYVYSWEKDRMWRKNRRPARDGVGQGGVDLNRNWGQNWGDTHGASDEPDHGSYHGTKAFSEPETRAVRNFVQERGDVAAMLDVHTFGQWIIYPASCRKSVSWGEKNFTRLANHIAASITQRTGAEYSAVDGTSFAYPACGDAADWFAETQHSYSLTLELRPGPSPDQRGFVQPASAIRPTSEDLIHAVERLSAWLGGQALGSPKLAAQGPQAEDQAPIPRSCSLQPWAADWSFSLGAMCCLGALGWKRFSKPPIRRCRIDVMD